MLDTKWKILSRKPFTKILAFVVLVLCFSVIVNFTTDINLKVKHYESIVLDDYLKSNNPGNELRNAANKLEYLIRIYKDREYIQEGKTVENLRIEDNRQIYELYENYLIENNYENTYEIKLKFKQEKNYEIEKIKQDIINTHLINYDNIVNELNNINGVIYYITDGKYECSNTDITDEEFYISQKMYLAINEKGANISPDNGDNTYSPSLVDKIERIKSGKNKTQIYVAITDEGLESRVDSWNYDRYILKTRGITIIVCAIIIIISFSILILIVGKRETDENIHLIFIDKLFTDINLMLTIGIVAISIAKYNDVVNLKYIHINFMYGVLFFSSMVICSLFMMLFLSIAKHIKLGTVLTYSLSYKIYSKLSNIIKNIVSSSPVMLKSIVAIIMYTILILIAREITYVLIILVFVSIYIIYKKVNDFEVIRKGIIEVKKGNYDFKIEVEGDGEFREISNDINAITDGIKIVVNNEVKSEKLKSELITNVSHDIKTPLTSIISYVDLLKREGLNSKNANKYLEILDKKSNRLKTLTEDLFEAAKLTSGNIKVNLQEVNINDLISQILGELDEKIQESNLDFKINTQEEKIFALADGRHLSRVMENLLSNIFKYALKNSRVYIDVVKLEKNVLISLKNISAKELNIPADELMERFKRGDESRSSEGNGLGLAIAKSLLEIQNGNLEINIDGDLFKCIISLKAVQK